MADSINLDLFWEILTEIQGGSSDLTEALKAIAKNDQAVAQTFMDNVIDQISYNSPDWQRLKNFIRDWYASHRSITTYQANISDPYQMPNDQLDDLFLSFGYDLAAILKNSTNNELPEGKVNFFLDLVNLYKRKGTPQALVDILQYYSISDIDVYELQLQFDERISKDPTDIIFKGILTAGTSGDKSPIYLPFKFLTDRDPHWLQTEAQIKQLHALNKINFPSTSPYFSVKPLFDEEAMDGATGILSRKVHDQYDIWNSAGQPDEGLIAVLPQDSVISILGMTTSMLTLYLSAIYTFNKEFIVGSPADRFICYDGTSVDAIDIMEEFRFITERKVLSRENLKLRWDEYIDTFSRPISENFLQTFTDAGTYLAILNPSVKNQLDVLATDNITVLGTLLRDLGEWIRHNLSYGFINMSYILFGLDSLFAELTQVINFWKPYRARLVPLEMVQFRNRLFNSIVIEDNMVFDVEEEIHDFITGDSMPCCTEQGIDSTTPVCIDSTATNRFYSRETYDCGSWHDIGAVTDMPQEVFIDYDDTIYDSLRCPAYYGDGTAAINLASNLDRPFAPIVTSEITDYTLFKFDIVDITQYSDTVSGKYHEVQTNLGYALTLNMFNEVDSNPSIYNYIITEKDYTGFTAKFSDVMNTPNYYVSYDYDFSDNSGIINVPEGANRVTVPIPPPPEIIDDTSYTVSISLSNLVDSNPSMYSYSVVERTTSQFTVQFSDVMDSTNYYLEWIVITHEKQDVFPLKQGWNSVTIPLYPYEINDNYGLSIALLNTVDATSSIIPFMVTDKTINGFTVTFDSPIDSPNYSLMWSRPIGSSWIAREYQYYQSGSFENFDGVPAYDGTTWVYVEGTEGRFDCTHGFDLVQIEVEDSLSYLLQETGDYLLQENGSRILL